MISPAERRLLAEDDSGAKFDRQQQEAYLYLLSRGASPAAACSKLGLSLVSVARYLESHEEFRGLVERVNALLSQNVAAALYREAMEGHVTAQTFYLKNCPPPEWPEAMASLSQPLNELRDDELIAQFRQEAPALLAQLAAADPASTGAAAPGSVSQPVATAR